MIINAIQEGINWVLANPDTTMIYAATAVGAATVALRVIAPTTKWKGDNKALAFMRDVLRVMSLDSTAKEVFKKLGVKKDEESK